MSPFPAPNLIMTVVIVSECLKLNKNQILFIHHIIRTIVLRLCSVKNDHAKKVDTWTKCIGRHLDQLPVEMKTSWSVDLLTSSVPLVEYSTS